MYAMEFLGKPPEKIMPNSEGRTEDQWRHEIAMSFRGRASVPVAGNGY